MHVSVCEFEHQACGHQFSILGIRPAGISQLFENQLSADIRFSFEAEFGGRIQERAHSSNYTHICSGEIGLRCCLLSLLEGGSKIQFRATSVLLR